LAAHVADVSDLKGAFKQAMHLPNGCRITLKVLLDSDFHGETVLERRAIIRRV